MARTTMKLIDGNELEMFDSGNANSSVVKSVSGYVKISGGNGLDIDGVFKSNVSGTGSAGLLHRRTQLRCRPQADHGPLLRTVRAFHPEAHQLRTARQRRGGGRLHF